MIKKVIDERNGRVIVSLYKFYIKKISQNLLNFAIKRYLYKGNRFLFLFYEFGIQTLYLLTSH